MKKPQLFKRILIANRGEIAIRVMRAARELGIESVAIYHKVDSQMPFVAFADYAVEIESESPKSAYLGINKIIEVAKSIGAEAIHPGYGFLSENAEFSQACDDAGIAFIGPKANSISSMGSKTGARKIMQAAGVPIVPGHNDRFENYDAMLKKAEEIGYPIMLKATAGGGGKGMRLVHKAEDLIENFESAQREAAKSFSNDMVYMEKFIVNPKHIEIQLIGDKHGNYVYLAERDCSVQRRHQKVVEEAPSTVLTEDIRRKMGEVAIAAAKACDYVNAGTIEFLLDINKDFYFLEMNTRLQVEHPVTEYITGIDLAKEQIRVAAGLPLSFSQEDIKIKGHAVEVRIYAENAQENFMPATGTIEYLYQPAGPGIRFDSGVEQFSEISIHFDPMIAKLIAYGNDRDHALDKLTAALKEMKIKGTVSNVNFLLQLINHPSFRNDYFDTGFLDKHFDFDRLKPENNVNLEELAAIAFFLHDKENKEKSVISSEQKPNKWKENQLFLRKLV